MSPNCPICRADASILLDRRDNVPLLQNRVWPDRGSAREAPSGALDFALCSVCGFAWNRAFEAGRLVYDPEYNNDQMGSQRFRAHVGAMIERMLKSLPPDHPQHLVEVGCGQGALLADLAQRRRFASLTGFDPAWRGEDGQAIGDITIHRRLFAPDEAGTATRDNDIVVSRHVIEHVADPLAFLRAIRSTMRADVGRLFLETPDIEWIVETFQPQDLFYEHCSIFSGDALQLALAATGFEALSVERVFDGQYLWAEARPADEKRISGGCNFAAAARAFAKRREHFVRDWHAAIAEMASSAVYLWGAASKGVTFALLVDPDGTSLAGAIDINRDKVGRFMPRTGVPIFAPSVLKNGDTVIIMNPSYHVEIAREIAGMGISARLLSLDAIESSGPA
jgi:SAM-dependent methyltransferase